MPAGTANLGNLVVKFGANLSELLAGKDRAAKELTSFEGRMASFAATIKRTLAVVGAGVAFKAMGDAIQQSIQHMDDLNKASQKFGVSVENFDKLTYAARVADVTLEELGQTAMRLSMRTRRIDEDTSDFAIALNTLGLSAKNADGSTKSLDQLMGDVAEKFHKYADGADKTALATAIFGRSGAKLIPLLNAGRDGLKEAAEEFKHLGGSITKDGAEKAEYFNDTLTRMAMLKERLVNVIVSRTLPAFQQYADGMLTAGKNTDNFNSWADVGVQTLEVLARGITTVIVFVQRFAAEVQAAANFLASFGSFNSEKISMAWQAMLMESQKTTEAFAKAKASADVMWSGWSVSVTKAGEDTKKAAAPIMATADAIQKALAYTNGLYAQGTALFKENMTVTELYIRKFDELEKLYTKGAITLDTYVRAQTASKIEVLQQAQAYDSLLTPMERVILKQEELRLKLQNGQISAQMFGRAMQEASAFSVQNMQDLASATASTLTSIFNKSKMAASAAAAINTAQAVTKAWATYPPPVSYAMAGLALAAGAAQIAKINSTSAEGGGSTSSAGTGAAPPAPAAAAQSGGGGGPGGPTIILGGGFSKKDFFDREFLRSMIQGINGQITNGQRIQFA